MRPIIVLNDPTSEGGRVVEGSPATFINGLAIARAGDRVSCPHGDCTIGSGDDTLLDDDKAVARDGDLTACGARLVATQRDTSVL
ncbi:PAAR domain-containing protein [Pseudomonas silesiensis]|uniref:PAAR domain-containing protein n=1 Tax=Pseudomonas silesiensis TaxID=1853130 RepID=UPI0030DA08D7